MASDVTFDFERQRRIGLSEAVLCQGKSPAQIGEIIGLARARSSPLLLTRLEPETVGLLAADDQAALDYDPRSHTAILGPWQPPHGEARVAVVTAGTSDLRIAREAIRTLAFYDVAAREIADVGVAGLWRILAHEEALRRFPVVIVVGGLVIAVPTSTGYGVAKGGETALHAALASCAPGLVSVNIDNGYGAACAAIRALGLHARQGSKAPR
jgi:pyridinium-3,5-biscarboxylic acid mononucleotide synthase